MKKTAFAALLHPGRGVVMTSILGLASLFIGSLTLTAIAFLHHIPVTPPVGLDLQALIRGQALQLLGNQSFWSIYPAMPPVNLLISPLNALIFVAIMLAGLGLWSLRRQVNPLLVNTILFLSVLIPYAIGWAALGTNNRPENAGWWLAFMLVGVFYISLASSVFSSVQLAKIIIPRD